MRYEPDSPTRYSANYPEEFMEPLLNGDGERPKTLSQRFSGYLSQSAQPKAKAAAEAAQAMTPAERRAAMSGLDANELKWSKAGLVLATVIGGFLTYYLAAKHPTRAVKVHGHTTQVPISESWILVYGAVLLFCAIGFIGVWKRKRTLVIFSIMISGFAITEFSAPIGFAFIVLGGWLLLRAYRLQRYGTANARGVARVAATRPPKQNRKAAAAAAKSTTPKPPSANKRYTPKAAPRRKVTKPSE
jgi:hypothetical protein